MAAGTWVWGHDSGVTEDFTGDFADGSGTGTVAGTGDDETVCIEIGQDWTLPAVNTGNRMIEITYDQYQSGSGTGTIEYRTASTKAACLTAGWNTYTVPFTSSGWVQVRMSKSA